MPAATVRCIRRGPSNACLPATLPALSALPFFPLSLLSLLLSLLSASLIGQANGVRKTAKQPGAIVLPYFLVLPPHELYLVRPVHTLALFSQRLCTARGQQGVGRVWERDREIDGASVSEDDSQNSHTH